jgi:adenylosuccinate synthase
MTAVGLTKLDVLTGQDPLRICVGYDFQGTRYDDFPAALQVLRGLEPIYEDHPGWKEPISGARSLDELPTNARKYLNRLEELTGTSMLVVSVGARREETMLLGNPFALSG